VRSSMPPKRNYARGACTSSAAQWWKFSATGAALRRRLEHEVRRNCCLTPESALTHITRSRSAEGRNPGSLRQLPLQKRARADRGNADSGPIRGQQPIPARLSERWKCRTLFSTDLGDLAATAPASRISLFSKMDLEHASGARVPAPGVSVLRRSDGREGRIPDNAGRLSWAHYDVSSDGQRFLVLKSVSESAAPRNLSSCSALRTYFPLFHFSTLNLKWYPYAVMPKRATPRTWNLWASPPDPERGP